MNNVLPTAVNPSCLVCVMYVEGTKQVLHAPIDQTPSQDVTVDESLGVWYFRKGTVHEAQFVIGRGVRVPEGKEFWGPMMVYDENNPDHVAFVTMNTEDLGTGKLLH